MAVVPTRRPARRRPTTASSSRAGVARPPLVVRVPVAVLLAAGGLLAPEAAGAEPVTLADGHADYGVRLVDGALRSQVRDGTGASVVWRDPGDVRFRLTSAARVTVPSPSAYAFLGPPGATTWLVPQTQRTDVVWLGWNTEALNAGSGATGDVTWTLEDVSGPGRVAVYVNDAFGTPSIVFDSGDGLPDSHAVPLGVHAHGNWAFSSPGTYVLRFTHRATIGGTVLQDTRSTTVVVDDVVAPPPTVAPPGSGSGGGAGATPGGGSAGGGTGAGAGGAGGTPDDGGRRGAGVAVRTRTARLGPSRRVPLRVRCTAARGACRGTVTLTTASRIVLRGERRVIRVGRATLRVPAGATRTVRVRVPQRLASELRRRPGRTLRLRATVSATVDGATRTASAPVRLRVR